MLRHVLQLAKDSCSIESTAQNRLSSITKYAFSIIVVIAVAVSLCVAIKVAVFVSVGGFTGFQ